MEKRILFIVREGMLPVWIEKNRAKFRVFHRSTLTGTFIDDNMFRVAVKSGPHWLQSIRGHRFKEVLFFPLGQSESLSPDERAILRSMVV